MERSALPNDFKEFLNLLNRHEVRYMVVGGYAVGYHGYPRTTNDLDVWVAADQKNIAGLLIALNAFGFSDPAMQQWAQSPRKTLRMGYPPVQIEVLTQISGVEFEQAHARRIEASFDDVSVFVISIGDLRANKRAAGRAKDQDDLLNLPKSDEK